MDGSEAAAAPPETEMMRVALLALSLAAPAAAQEFRPRTEYEAATERPKPLPAIPPMLRGIVRAPTPERLLVRTLGGGEVAVDISWYEVERFEPRPGGRFLGIVLSGYEAEGYVLVDRAGAGTLLETGVAPVFSPDGRWFAAAGISEAGWGNLEGVAVWEVLSGSSVRRFFSDTVPHGTGWRVDGWPRRDCVALSHAPANIDVPEDMEWDEAVRRAPRTHYAIRVDRSPIALSAGSRRPACI
jgi:hypothetical protein